VLSLVGVVTAVTSAITGAVVSVVVVVLSPEPPPQPIIRIDDSNRIDTENKNEKIFSRTLLEINIKLPVFFSFS